MIRDKNERFSCFFRTVPPFFRREERGSGLFFEKKRKIGRFELS